MVSTSDTFLLVLSWTTFALAMIIFLGTAAYKAVKHSNNIIKILTPSENLNVKVQEGDNKKLSPKAIQYSYNTAGETAEIMLEQF